jgi:hypothetical protein
VALARIGVRHERCAHDSRAAPITAAIPIAVDMAATADTTVVDTTMDAIPTRSATAILPIRTGATTTVGNEIRAAAKEGGLRAAFFSVTAMRDRRR